MFENFNDSYAKQYFNYSTVRTPDRAVSGGSARLSLQLTSLSAFFIVEASYFFAVRQDSWIWEKLESLALTSKVLANDADASAINSLLQDAAAAGLRMPKLHTIELWNGQRSTAIVSRYQRGYSGDAAIITLRETTQLALGSHVL
jgi:hypothetical protein